MALVCGYGNGVSVNACPDCQKRYTMVESKETPVNKQCPAISKYSMIRCRHCERANKAQRKAWRSDSKKQQKLKNYARRK
jgi:hypothetical protein